MKRFFALTAAALLATFMLVGCGSNSSNSTTPGQSQQSGHVFVTEEDAPLPSVVGFDVTINSITLNGQSNSPQVVSTPTTVDFARLIGLRSPLAFNTVPPDTYNSATFVLVNPVISYVDMTQNPPALNTINGTLAQSPYTMTVNFPTPMVVGSNELAGLKMEFDIRQSLAVDGNGQVTGVVNPVIYIKATKASDPDGRVTDLTGGLVSVTAANNSFVIQGPYGRQLTVYVSNNTEFNSGWNINDLTPPAIVAVQGAFQADGSLMADSVEVITTAQSFLSGRVLQVKSSGGQAQSVTMWVGETGADMVSNVDTIQTIDISAVTDYEICFLDGPLTNALFNDTSIEVGQRIFIGGSYVNPTFTPQMISLRRQGVYGMFVPGSVNVTNGNAGSFQLSNNGLIGYAAGGPVTVYNGSNTVFFNLSGLSALEGDTTAVPLITRGLFLKDPNTGNPAFFAGFVSEPPQATN